MQVEKRFATQISSKYSPDNPGVFELKKRLRKLAFAPAFPRGTEILLFTPQEFAITTPDEAAVPFDVTQIDFFRRIKENGFHTVYNVRGEDTGYMGESTSVETAYAVVLGKPIILEDRHNLHFGERVKSEIATFITKNVSSMNGLSPMGWWFDVYDLEDIAKDIVDTTTGRWRSTAYDVTDADKEMVMRNVLDLTRKYRQTWNAYQQEAA